MTEKQDSIHRSPETFRASIFDTEYLEHKKAFGTFRDAIHEAFMPWAMELDSEDCFDARVECLFTSTEAVARGTSTPIVAVRGNREILKSPSDSFYANYVLVGDLNIEQGGRSFHVRRGDLIVYDSNLPLKMTQKSEKAFDHVAFRIPKEKFAESQHAESLLRHAVIPAEKMMIPLASCLNFLANNLLTADADELRALYDTCTLLMPLSAAHLENESPRSGKLEVSPKHYVRELTNYIDTHIGDSALSPRSAAISLGISVRYVHKLFAITGATFSAHVMTKRLELVRRDLASAECRHQPIFGLAYRWGFNDISTFIRAFKKKYGCSPSEYRAQF
jgi:AraC-like DNA-binding protein